MGSSFKLWDKRLNGDLLSKGQITQFCNAVVAGSCGYIIGGHHTNLTGEECIYLVDKFIDRCKTLNGAGYRLTKEQTDFGYEWLRAIPKRAESVGVTRDILDVFTGFRFVDWEVIRYSTWSVRAQIIPVYRVLTSNDGLSVDYSWSPWQQKAYA
jgi:hypothetical protein